MSDIYNRTIKHMNLKELVERAIDGLEWELIKHVCLKTKCDWFSIDDNGACINKGKVDRMAYDAMKQDLKKIIKFALDTSKDRPMYVGPWMIEWELNTENYSEDECNALTVQFIMSAVTVCDDGPAKKEAVPVKIDKTETLRKQLKDALDVEDYERAGRLRDALQNLASK